MKAIILVGGKGQRLNPLTLKIPKPMVDVAGFPVLLHAILHLKQYGIKKIILAVCYRKEQIKEYFGTGQKWGVEIEYIEEKENMPLGTAGAIAKAKNKVKGPFVVLYGDILRQLNIKQVIAHHKKTKAFATVVLHKISGDRARSLVVFDKSNKISSFVEHPKKKLLKNPYVWSNGSFYVFEPEIFELIPESFSDFGKDIFPTLLRKKKRVFAYPSEDYLLDIGEFVDLEQARMDFKP